MSGTAHSEPLGDLAVPPPPFRWGTRVLLPAILAIGFAALLAGSLFESLSPVVEVATTPVIQRPCILRKAVAEDSGDSAAVVQAAGWIMPDPFPTLATALANGVVEEVLFLEGDTVEKGDVLVRLDAEDAELALARAEAELQAAEETWEANIEATRSAAVSEAAVRETSGMLRQARAELRLEQALLDNAEAVLSRTAQLIADEVKTPQEHDTAKAEALAQAARVEVARSRIAELEATLTRMESERAASQRRLELRTEERRRLDLARVALAEAELRVERMEVAAPISGVVMERLVEPGSMLMPYSEKGMAAHAASLYDPRRLQVRVDVPLADAAKVGRGQRALVEVEVMPGQVFEGRVTRIMHLADIQKNTLEARVALDSPSKLLKPDMLARVRLMAAPEADDEELVAGLSVFAPLEAIEGGTVWVVSDFDGGEGRAAKRTVTTTGAVDGGWAEVESGLLPGDLLVVSQEEPLEAGQRVRVREAGGT